MRRALVIACWLAALPAQAFEVLKDADGHQVAWTGPVVFVADQALAARLCEAHTLEAVQAAVGSFNGLTAALAVSVSSGETQDFGYDTASGAHNQNSIVALDSWPFAAHNLAATVVTLNRRTNEIIDADIAFNIDEWRFRVLNPGSVPGDGPHDVNDIQNTLTHEVGHALGLKHNDSDAHVVMYPGAPAGEISKRLLAEDDRLGLLLLYPVTAAQTPGEPLPVGCSATGGGFEGALLAMLGFLFSRRRVLAAAMVAALPLAAQAEAPAAAPPASQAPDRVALGEVTQLRSSWLRGTRLIVTDVEVAVRTCTQTPCDRLVVLRVPGGRMGDLEQVVSHNPVPNAGETVVVTWKKGQASLVRLR